MNNKVKVVIAFVAGFIGGLGTGYLFFKKKFEKKADHEINTTKEALLSQVAKEFSKESLKDKKEPDKKLPQTKSISSIDLQKPQSKMSNNVDYGKQYRSKEEDPREMVTPNDDDKPIDRKTIKKHEKQAAPYVISPDEYVDNTYEKQSLIFWNKDKTLSDSDYNLVQDPNVLVGKDALTSFGRYEQDVVYVCDDVKQVAYEIDMDLRSYEETAPVGCTNRDRIDKMLDETDGDD